jgi:hypothetical protein
MAWFFDAYFLQGIESDVYKKTKYGFCKKITLIICFVKQKNKKIPPYMAL